VDPVRVALTALGLELLGRLVAVTGERLGGGDFDEANEKLMKDALEMGARSLAALTVAEVAAEELLFFALPLFLGGIPLLACAAAVWWLLHVRQYAPYRRSSRRPKVWLAGVAVGYASITAARALLWATPPLGLLSAATHAGTDVVALLKLRDIKEKRERKMVEEWKRKVLEIAERLEPSPEGFREEWDYYDEEYARRKAGLKAGEREG
jgi:hypothetical protein